MEPERQLTLAYRAAQLVVSQRWAALGTVDDEGPFASMVAYAPEADLAGLLMFLSGLSLHTRNLMADERVSLVIGVPDGGDGDPQALPRISLRGRVTLIDRADPGFPMAWSAYTARFPQAAPRIALGDFGLFRFTPEQVRFVGGFAQAARLSVAQLRDGWRELAG